jgi:signal transduction histidine kinase
MKSDDPHEYVADSIRYAIHELTEALAAMDQARLQSGPGVGWVAHAMSNYVSVNEATLNLISQAISTHPNRELVTWIEGLRHLGVLMHHTVTHLITSGRPAEFPLKPEYINLPVLMERACDYYRPRAVQKGVRIICRVVGDVPLAWADRVVVAVVADNLLSYATQASPVGGEVVVDVLPGPGGVTCSVRDTGPGQTPLQQAMLFSQSVGGEPVFSPGEPHPNLGLVFAKEFVERMGGKLWSESDIGAGTSLSFRLPYHASGPAAAPMREAT